VFVVDTNILVYAAEEESPFHQPCRQLLTDARRQASAWYLTWGIAYEFLRVTTHPRVFRKPWNAQQAWGFLASLFASPSLGMLTPGDRHQLVVQELVREIPHIAGNLWHDAHIAVLMREHGIRRIYTRDTDFHRFPFIEPIDPLSAKPPRGIAGDRQ
jgi:toxin-antitoxin system PIN domain toxin